MKNLILILTLLSIVSCNKKAEENPDDKYKPVEFHKEEISENDFFEVQKMTVPLYEPIQTTTQDYWFTQSELDLKQNTVTYFFSKHVVIDPPPCECGHEHEKKYKYLNCKAQTQVTEAEMTDLKIMANEKSQYCHYTPKSKPKYACLYQSIADSPYPYWQSESGFSIASDSKKLRLETADGCSAEAFYGFCDEQKEKTYKNMAENLFNDFISKNIGQLEQFECTEQVY